MIRRQGGQAGIRDILQNEGNDGVANVEVIDDGYSGFWGLCSQVGYTLLGPFSFFFHGLSSAGSPAQQWDQKVSSPRARIQNVIPRTIAGIGVNASELAAAAIPISATRDWRDRMCEQQRVIHLEESRSSIVRAAFFNFGRLRSVLYTCVAVSGVVLQCVIPPLAARCNNMILGEKEEDELYSVTGAMVSGSVSGAMSMLWLFAADWVYQAALSARIPRFVPLLRHLALVNATDYAEDVRGIVLTLFGETRFYGRSSYNCFLISIAFPKDLGQGVMLVEEGHARALRAINGSLVNGAFVDVWQDPRSDNVVVMDVFFTEILDGTGSSQHIEALPAGQHHRFPTLDASLSSATDHANSDISSRGWRYYYWGDFANHPTMMHCKGYEFLDIDASLIDQSKVNSALARGDLVDRSESALDVPEGILRGVWVSYAFQEGAMEGHSYRVSWLLDPKLEFRVQQEHSSGSAPDPMIDDAFRPLPAGVIHASVNGNRVFGGMVSSVSEGLDPIGDRVLCKF